MHEVPDADHVIPAKAGIWTRAILRRILRRPGVEEGRTCGDEQAAGKGEQEQQAA